MNGCSDVSAGVVSERPGWNCVCACCFHVLPFECSCILERGEEAGPYPCRSEPLFLAASGRSEKF